MCGTVAATVYPQADATHAMPDHARIALPLYTYGMICIYNAGYVYTLLCFCELAVMPLCNPGGMVA